MKKSRIFIILISLLNLSLLLFLVTRFSMIPAVKAESGQEDPFFTVQDRFNRVSAEVLPSIVEIDVESFQSKDDSGPIPWEDFFDLPENQEPDEKDFRTYGLGSGILVRQEGNTYYSLTNYHVTGDAAELTVSLEDGRVFEGTLIGTDERKDLALVSFESEASLPIAQLGDSDELRVGDWVLAMGSPLGYKSSVTFGIISALGRMDSPDGNINDFIQTDAAINQGNSGGALVSMQGEIVGINTWISTSTGGNMGLAFSIPINNAKKNIDDFIQFGSIQYGWLGVSIGDLNDFIIDDYRHFQTKGVLVYQVFSNSPAEKAGIEPGDLILSINGLEAVSRKALTFMIGELYPGDIAEFEVYRDSTVQTFKAEIEKRGDENSLGQLSPQAWPGITLLPLNEKVQEALDLQVSLSGVMVDQVFPQTAFQKAGVLSGDVLKSINNEEILSLDDFYRLLRTKGPIIELKLERLDEGKEYTYLIERYKN